MFTGNRPFDGDNVSDTLAAVLRVEPDWNALPAELPLAIRALLRRCLEKDPRKRIADLSTARFVIDLPDLIPATPSSRPAWRRLTAVAALALIAAGALGIAAWSATRAAPPSGSVVRFDVPVPQGQNLAGNTGLPLLSLSPDGEHLVYGASGRLYLRSMSDATPRPIPGTEGRILKAPSFHRTVNSSRSSSGRSRAAALQVVCRKALSNVSDLLEALRSPCVKRHTRLA